MELYKFVKDRELKQNHTLTYHAGYLKEITTKVESTGGISFPNSFFKSIFIFGFKGVREWTHISTDMVDINHVIEGDQVPRIVYSVYRLGHPLYGTKHKKEETIEGQNSMVERLFMKRKKYPKYHHKSVHQQFMFYACIEVDTNDSYKWPNVFLVGEQELRLHSLDQDLAHWGCLHSNAAQIQVKSSNAYLKFKSIPPQLSTEKIMIFAYLNSIKNIECDNCLHKWTLFELWELLELKKMHSRDNAKEILDDIGYELQTKYKFCGLWTYYFPITVFIKRTPNNDGGVYSHCLRWLLNY